MNTPLKKESLSPVDLPRRMTDHLALGPQVLSRSGEEPMQRYHVESERGELELRISLSSESGETVQWMQNETVISGADGDYHLYQNHHQKMPLMDQSSRGKVTPENALVVGFVIGKSHGKVANKQYLLRVLGPSLSKFDIPTGLKNPRVSLTRNGKPFDHLMIDDREFVETWSPKVGAFALVKESGEFLRRASLPAGNYSLTVESTNGESGDVLVEIYETAA